MSGMFHVKQSTRGDYYFVLTAKNGEVLLTSSMSFESKNSTLEGIKHAKNLAQESDNFTIINTPNGDYFFTLRAKTGAVVGLSQAYRSQTSAKNGMESVRNYLAHSKTSLFTKRDTHPNTTIGSVTTFLTALEKIEKNLDSKIFYRGHGSSEYKLIPSIFRNPGWIQNEDTMFKELMIRCPGDFNLSGQMFNSLVKMQHYSLPTRLLDITANPLIALYFACEGGEEKDAEVIAFRIPKNEIKYHDSDTVSVIANLSRMPYSFSPAPKTTLKQFNAAAETTHLVREIQREKPYFENRIEPDHITSVVCVKPILDNPRIIKQDGAFLIFGMSDKKTEPAEVPEKYLASTGDQKIIIRGSEKRKILQQLESLGVTRQSIYPEIEHVAVYIRTAYMELSGIHINTHN